MEKEQINNSFEIESFMNIRFLMKLNDRIITFINRNKIQNVSYFLLILNYINLNNTNNFFLKYKDDGSLDIEFVDRTLSFFREQFGICIDNIKEEVYFINIDSILYILENKKITYNEESMKYIIKLLKNCEYNNYKFNVFIKTYKLLPVYKKWLVKKSLEVPEYYDTNGFNNFMNNEILRKYSLENDVKIFNEKGKEIISIEDDKSPLFMFLNIFDYKNNNFELDMSKEKETYFINPNMAKIFRGNVLSIDLMLNMLGYSTKEIFELIKKVSNKKLSLAIIGLGGTMSNFVYFVTELAKFFRLEKNVFKNVVVYDNDLLEVSNLPRIPLDYITPIFCQTDMNKGHHKVSMLCNVDKLADKIISSVKKVDMDYRIEENFNFIIGTPDISTRTMISQMTNNFICPMHSDNELYIYIAPEVVGSDLMYETYGRIRLSKFFFNMLEMTIQCLKLMLNDNLDSKAGELVYEYSIDNIDINKNMIDFKRKERVMI